MNPGRARALSTCELGALDRDGFVVVEGALDVAWIERLGRAFSEAPSQKDGTQHVLLSPTTPEIGAWEALRTHPMALQAAEHVLQAPFRVRDLHGRNPLPGYGGQGLHADWLPRSAVLPFVVVTAIWMIDAFTHDNGATRVVPGSHRITRPIARELAQPGAAHQDELVAVGPAGSVLLLNGHTWHSGRRNEGRGLRRAAQMVVVRVS